MSNPGPPLPGEFTIQSTLRQHFGDRYAMTWLTMPHQSDGSDRRVVVAVVSPRDDAGIDAALRDARPDLVSVHSPPFLHAAHVRRVLGVEELTG